MTDTDTEDRSNWEWLPDAWCDEVRPSTAKDVNAFIHKKENGEFWLGPDDEEWDQWPDCNKQQLHHGEIIEFAAHEQFDDISLTVTETGFEAWPRNLFRANGFRLEDAEHDDEVFDSIDLLVGNRDTGRRLAPGTYTVECWWWSWGEPYKYRFLIDGDNGHFVPVREGEQ